MRGDIIIVGDHHRRAAARVLVLIEAEARAYRVPVSPEGAG